MGIGFIKWIGHASFIFEIHNKKVYIDPFRLKKHYDSADIILISHTHFDHLSIEDIKKIAASNTEIFVPHDGVDTLKGCGKITGVEPYKNYKVEGLEFSTVPAYNTVSERLGFHPKKNNWVGYIINANNMKVYHSGDTDFIEEMKKIKVDLALLPMGGTYTMDINEAINAANSMNAKNVIPMHYKALLGEKTSSEAEKTFKNKVKNSIILKEVQEPYYSF